MLAVAVLALWQLLDDLSGIGIMWVTVLCKVETAVPGDAELELTRSGRDTSSTRIRMRSLIGSGRGCAREQNMAPTRTHFRCRKLTRMT